MIKKLAFETKTRLVGQSSRETYKRFLAEDALEPEQLQKLNDQRAIEHARFAMEHSPFYRELYSSAGFTPSDLHDPAAFTSLPFVDKNMLRDNFETVKSDEANETNSAVSSTGGSTGLPLRLLRDERFPARALEWRLFHWWGVNPWDDRGIITRNMLTGRAKLRHDLQWLPSRRVQLDAFSITDDSVRAFVAEWNRRKPPFLLGYGGGVLEVARRVERLGLDFAAPAAIAVTAAPLTDGVRSEIQTLLGAPCYDHYRSAEVPWIGGECEKRDGLHVFSGVRHVEILDDNDHAVAAGTEGNVIVSDLTNRVFPIVRYRIGDISSLRPDRCACGRGLPRLGAISGRRSDAVRLPDGTMIAGALGHIFDSTPLAVRQFEIVQAADYSVTLRCIVGTPRDALDGIANAEKTLRAAVRGLVPVTVELVDSIATVGGKMRFIRSDVPAPVASETGK